MIRRIIHIDEEKCNGCGLCANACHEGAIGMVDGKARLLRDDYCDGLGDCLPACPTGAITFVEREAAAYDAEAVKIHMEKRAAAKNEAHSPSQHHKMPGGCPGSTARFMNRRRQDTGNTANTVATGNAGNAGAMGNTGGAGNTADLTDRAAGDFANTGFGKAISSQLSQWPVQIKLAPVKAPYFENAKLLVAADCTAYAYGNFHNDFIKDKITLIGCPKLDSIDYSEKLTEIIRQNNIKSITVVRMEVPCCGGIENAVKKALADSGKLIPWQVVTISIDGQILDRL